VGVNPGIHSLRHLGRADTDPVVPRSCDSSLGIEEEGNGDTQSDLEEWQASSGSG
jgi:hypothetical protein